MERSVAPNLAKITASRILIWHLTVAAVAAMLATPSAALGDSVSSASVAALPNSIIVCTSPGFTPDRSTPALPSSTAETSTKAPQKAAERRPDAAGEADFLEHCFIVKRVLIGSNNYFTAGPKRSTSSFHEAMIFAFVFRAL